MKKILCKVLVLALVLCLVLPQTVMAATYNVSVSIELKTDATKKVTQDFSYKADTTLLVDMIAEAFILQETAMRDMFETGLDPVVQEAKAAYQDQALWTPFVAQFDANFVNADLKAACSDLTSTIGSLPAGTYEMEYNNAIVSETYVVTLTSTKLGMGGGGGGGVVTPVTPVTPAHTCYVEHLTDVDVTAWYHDAVCYCVENGIMVGVDADTFDINGNLTRGMLMTMLAREAGADTAGAEPWYAKGMEWAVANGVSDGTNPEADITREQLVTMLYRYAKQAGKDVSAADELAAFPDAADVSDWALDATKWAVATGVMKGADGKIVPQGTATRIEAAQFFYNFETLVLSK